MYKVLILKTRFLIPFFLIIVFIFVSCSSSESGGGETTSTRDSQKVTATRADGTREFKTQVQDVCNSVDPVVFKKLFGLDPAKDPTYGETFDEAISSLKSLREGFSALNPPANQREDWDSGIKNLQTMEDTLTEIKGQYDQYVALLEEKETSQDISRQLEIAQELITLLTQYTQNLQELDLAFKEVLSIGSRSGIARCRAFEIA